VISPTLTPLIAQHFGWVRALDFAAVVALGAAVLWLTVIPSQKLEHDVSAPESALAAIDGPDTR
jgi:cyanate permease